MAISRQKEGRSRDYSQTLFRMTSRVFNCAQFLRQSCTLHEFEQFGALYVHNKDDKYPARPGFEPGTSRLQAPVDAGPALERRLLGGSCSWKIPCTVCRDTDTVLN